LWSPVKDLSFIRENYFVRIAVEETSMGSLENYKVEFQLHAAMLRNHLTLHYMH
jgi:hypothetical protein